MDKNSFSSCTRVRIFAGKTGTGKNCKRPVRLCHPGIAVAGGTTSVNQTFNGDCATLGSSCVTCFVDSEIPRAPFSRYLCDYLSSSGKALPMLQAFDEESHTPHCAAARLAFNEREASW